MGGNDFSVFGTLIGYCTSVRNQDPTGSPCSSALGDGLFGSLDKMGDRMTRALHGIVQRSPHAQVLVVGYPVLISSARAARASCRWQPVTSTSPSRSTSV